MIETVTTYGLLMVMNFATLEQCEMWAEKLYNQDKGACFQQFEEVYAEIQMPPERPEFLRKQIVGE
tara:strand:+ start:606 stop:803 length:198 start_codon:yes stop_codon:yes gene_type:complete